MSEQDPNEFRLLEDLMQPIMDALEQRKTHGPAGWRTGLAELDALTGGLQRGDVWAVTGRSGVGKTVFALTLARSVALLQRVPTRFASRRETSTQLGERLLSSHCRVPLSHLLTGEMTDDDWSRLARFMSEVGAAPLQFGRSETPTRAVLEAVDAEDGLIVVDDVPIGQERAACLRDLKQLAGAQGAGVVAVLQDSPTECQAVSDDGAAESADLVLRIEREDHRDYGSARVGEVDLVVTHNRRGPLATMTVVGQFHLCRLVEMRA